MIRLKESDTPLGECCWRCRFLLMDRSNAMCGRQGPQLAIIDNCVRTLYPKIALSLITHWACGHFQPSRSCSPAVLEEDEAGAMEVLSTLSARSQGIPHRNRVIGDDMEGDGVSVIWFNGRQSVKRQTTREHLHAREMVPSAAKQSIDQQASQTCRQTRISIKIISPIVLMVSTSQDADGATIPTIKNVAVVSSKPPKAKLSGAAKWSKRAN